MIFYNYFNKRIKKLSLILAILITFTTLSPVFEASANTLIEEANKIEENIVDTEVNYEENIVETDAAENVVEDLVIEEENYIEEHEEENISEYIDQDDLLLEEEVLEEEYYNDELVEDIEGVSIAGISAEEWNSMSDEDQDLYLDYIDERQKATGNTGAGISVGGWTGADGTTTDTLKIPPITIDGRIAYCMQYIKAFPVNIVYGNPYATSNEALRSIIYHGYPNNGSGLKEKYNLDNETARQYTQFAIWKIMGYVGDGLPILDRRHPYVDELVSLSKSGDIGPYKNPEFNLSKSSLKTQKFNDYQETEPILTSGSPGTFNFPSTNEIWSVDLNGNKKSTFNIGEAFKVRSINSFDGVKNFTIEASLRNAEGRVYPGGDQYQDILEFAFGININRSIEINIEFTNEEPTGVLNIFKDDIETGEALANVEFKIASTSGAINGVEIYVITNEEGYASVELPLGDYHLIETKELEGYVKDESHIAFSITTEGEEIRLDVSNEKITGDAKLYKYDAETNEPLEGVKFKLRCIDGFNNGSEIEVTSDSNGVVNMDNLYYGKYIIQETKALEGYILDENPIEFEIRNNGELVNLNMENTAIKGKIKIVKLDGLTEERLQGAVFGIYDVNGKYVETLVTDANGEAITSELKYGKYYYKELKAPVGYQIDKKLYSITIDTNEVIKEVSFKNYPTNYGQELSGDGDSNSNSDGNIENGNNTNTSSISKLPNTGSVISNAMILIAGVIIILLGILFVKRK
ncbi:SpaA isopeptide-forming pilin-related protein [Clostridium sp.]|uniref:SpaA isopeptide-forming pilin-related protein n=1 Tax=Clostridium sp. TaxID=1506 RepID=UPI003F668D1E